MSGIDTAAISATATNNGDQTGGHLLNQSTKRLEPDASGTTPAAGQSSLDASNADGQTDAASDVETGAEAAASDSDDRLVGRALRSAYQAMVKESIPDEMLDLLNRLK